MTGPFLFLGDQSKLPLAENTSGESAALEQSPFFKASVANFESFWIPKLLLA